MIRVSIDIRIHIPVNYPLPWSKIAFSNSLSLYTIKTNFNSHFKGSCFSDQSNLQDFVLNFITYFSMSLICCMVASQDESFVRNYPCTESVARTYKWENIQCNYRVLCFISVQCPDGLLSQHFKKLKCKAVACIGQHAELVFAL